MKVKMLQTTSYKGLRSQGQVYDDIPDNVALRWKKNGIAALSKADLAKLEQQSEIDEGEEGADEDGSVQGTSNIAESSPVSGDASGKPSPGGKSANKKGK